MTLRQRESLRMHSKSVPPAVKTFLGKPGQAVITSIAPSIGEKLLPSDLFWPMVTIGCVADLLLAIFLAI